jgi:hypothetical protein
MTLSPITKLKNILRDVLRKKAMVRHKIWMINENRIISFKMVFF